MPVESKKLRRLREMRDAIAAGKLADADLRALRLNDTDGTLVRLDDENALAVIDRRIAAEEADAPPV